MCTSGCWLHWPSLERRLIPTVPSPWSACPPALSPCSLGFRGSHLFHLSTPSSPPLPSLRLWVRFSIVETNSRPRGTGSVGDSVGEGDACAQVPVIIYSLVIMMLNKAYRQIAEYLTDLENHRLARDYETSLILKRVLFESFDCYAVLLYIAFYQFNCTRLRNEVLALYTTDEVRRVLLESVIPYLTQLLRFASGRS
eukprot:Tamp_22644.p2 GENE.Tamp_22644~~Tamp_22644.p2  ORF type:complete len:197 (+),score=22.03 Tamp_22644:353-943(+)